MPTPHLQATAATTRRARIHARELAALALHAAAYPTGLLRGVAGRSTAAGVPIVLVHGFGANKTSWLPLAALLTHHGRRPTVVVEHNAFTTGLDALTDVVADAVRTLPAGAGAVVVGHSLGGVLARAAVCRHRDVAARVATTVAIGAPLGGSPLAHLLRPLHALPWAVTGRHLTADSPWLAALAASPLPGGVRHVTVRSHDDLIVPAAHAHDPHAHDDVLLDGVGHVGLLAHQPALAAIVDEIDRADARCA